MTDSGVRQMLERRCKDAGVDPIHPHQFRHTMAHRWFAAGGQETDLMRLAGWRSREMVGRYAPACPCGGRWTVDLLDVLEGRDQTLRRETWQFSQCVLRPMRAWQP